MEYAFSQDCMGEGRQGHAAPLSRAPEFALYGPHSRNRRSLENYVAEGFHAAHGATVNHFLPFLLGMRCLGCLRGVAGMGPAGADTLFLEQYLNDPAEKILAQLTGLPVHRRSLVEVGNVAAAGRGGSQLLFVAMTSMLHQAGFEWIVFTATRALANNLEKLGYPTLALAAADPGRLPPGEAERWGRYYESGPQVRAGKLSDAAAIIARRPSFRQAKRLFEEKLDLLTEELLRETGHAA